MKEILSVIEQEGRQGVDAEEKVKRMSEELSAEDIDLLLTAIDSESGGPEGVKPAGDGRMIRIYDFKRPDRFTREQLRAISLIHERFARELTAPLADCFKAETHIHVASVDQLDYEAFTRCIPTPSAIAVLVSELKGAFILQIDPAISRAMLNRLFGGKGGEPGPRELTALEMKVMGDLISGYVLKPLQDAWENVIDLNPVLARLETNPRFAPLAPPYETTVVISFECGIGEAEGMLNLCFPYQSIVPVLKRLNARWWYSGRETRKEEGKEEEMRIPLPEALERIPVSITVQLGRALKPLKEVKGLEAGSVIELDTLAGEALEVYAGGVLIGKGEAVVIVENFGIRISEVSGGGNG